MSNTNEPTRLLDLSDNGPMPEARDDSPVRQILEDTNVYADETDEPEAVTVTTVTDMSHAGYGHQQGDVKVTVANGPYAEAAAAVKAYRIERGLDYTYESHRVPHPTLPGKFIPNRQVIVRADFAAKGIDKCWGPFTDAYYLNQLDGLDLLAGVVLQEDCRIISSMEMDQGGAVLITAERKSLRADGNGPGGLSMASLFTFIDSVNGSHSRRCANHSLVIDCKNAIGHEVYGGKRMWAQRHTKGANDRLIALGQEIARGGEYEKALRKRLFAYEETTISLDKAARFIQSRRMAEAVARNVKADRDAKLTEKQTTKLEALVERDMADYSEAPGAANLEDSFLKLHQWCSFTSTHRMASSAVLADEARLLEYSAFGAGQTWQNDVVGALDSWWQEEAKAQGVQHVVLA